MGAWSFAEFELGDDPPDLRRIKAGQRQEIPLTSLESQLLICLVKHAPKPVTVTTLNDEVPHWRYKSVNNGAVQQVVRRLRRKLGPKIIDTRPGGYIIVPRVTGDLQYAQTGDVPLRIYPKSTDAFSDFGRFVANCKSTIILCGVHFNPSISDRRQEYIEALLRGVYVSIVVVEPGSDMVREAAKCFDMDPAELKMECELGVVGIQGLSRDYLSAQPRVPGRQGTLSLRYCKQFERLLVCLFDHKLDSGKILVIQYTDGRRSSHTKAFLFAANSDTAARLVEFCEKVWSEARPMDHLLYESPQAAGVMGSGPENLEHLIDRSVANYKQHTRSSFLFQDDETIKG